jgi:hypothetical protein
MPLLLERTEIGLEQLDVANRTLQLKHNKNTGKIEIPARSSGIHMSGILRPLGIAAKELKDWDRDGDGDDKTIPGLWTLGNAWEEYCASLYPDMDYQPGEVECDGIFMTCDGINVIGNNAIIEEFKFTTKKPRIEQEFLDEWMYMHQGRAYCYGYGDRGSAIRLVRWHVMHIPGWKYGPPTYWRYLVEFTEKEIRQTWAMLVNNKDAAEKETHIPAPASASASTSAAAPAAARATKQK